MFRFQFKRFPRALFVPLSVVATFAVSLASAPHVVRADAALDSPGDEIEDPRLPDGYFTGPLLAVADDGMTTTEVGALTIQIVHGFIVSATVLTHGTTSSITLTPMTAPDDPELRMNGRAESGFVRIHGEFWEPRAAMGAFEGVIASKKARGIWSVTRR